MSLKQGLYLIERPAGTVDYKDFSTEEYKKDWDHFNLWQYKSTTTKDMTRATNVNYPEERGIIMLNVRIASPPPRFPNVEPGKMSSWIFNLNQVKK